MVALLLRSSVCFYRRHPLQLLLSFLGIVLGVSIVTAVLITNRSAQRAFEITVQSLYGATTHQIEGALGVPQEQYTSLRKSFPSLHMAPVIEGHVEHQGNVLSVLGLDPLAELFFERSFSESNNALSAVRHGVLVNRRTLEQLQLTVGEPLELNSGGVLHSLDVIGEFSTLVDAAGEGLILTDIAIAQSLLNKNQRIDRIDLMIDETDAVSVAAQLPPGLRIVPASQRQQSMQSMTRGFQINLTAMSLLALVVGLFLIHNTMTFAVLQRRENYAVKRVVGVTSRALGLSVLAESALISLAASVTGLLLGYHIAGLLIALTTQTINDLYFVLHVQELWFPPSVAVLGIFLGVGSSLLAASLAALEAAQTDPINATSRSHIESQNQRVLPWLASFGASLIVLGLTIGGLSTTSLLWGFIALTLVLIGYGCAIPFATLIISRKLHRRVASWGIAVSMAIGSVQRNISRTGIAIAALTIAVAATFGVNVMIESFRTSVDRWLATTLQSDFYVSVPQSDSSQAAQSLSDEFLKTVEQLPGVSDTSTSFVIKATTRSDKINLRVLSPHAGSPDAFHFLELNEGGWTFFSTNDAVFISEPLATKNELRPGDVIELFTEFTGYQPFIIAGVYQDYGSSHGRMTMHINTYQQHWSEQSIASIGLIVSPDADRQRVETALKALIQQHRQPLLYRSNTDIHKESLAIFDRTFEVTRVLRWLTVAVAVIGIFSALLALHLERAKEFAILRACGTTRRQILQIVMLQTLYMGLMAGALALPLGWVMSEVLIKVINVRSFGWSMAGLIPPGAVTEALAIAVVSALVAGLYPAWRIGKFSIAAQIRSE